MILKKPASPHATKFWFGRTVLASGLALCLLVLLAMVQKNWGRAVTLSCIVYTVAVGLFFIAQLFGFILSQTDYSEAVEAPKFDMLEKEARQWKS